MNSDISALPDNTSVLKKRIHSLTSAHTDMEEKYKTSQDRIHYLEEHIRLIQKEIFVRKSEKCPSPESDQQHCLFNEAESSVKDAMDESGNEITVPAHTRKTRGCKPLPEDLPRIDVAHILTAKLEDALPFYRQEKIFARMGVEISLANMGVKVAGQCRPLLAIAGFASK